VIPREGVERYLIGSRLITIYCVVIPREGVESLSSRFLMVSRLRIRYVIPREGVESGNSRDFSRLFSIRLVIPREGVESSSLSGYFDRSFE